MSPFCSLIGKLRFKTFLGLGHQFIVFTGMVHPVGLAFYSSICQFAQMGISGFGNFPFLLCRRGCLSGWFGWGGFTSSVFSQK